MNDDTTYEQDRDLRDPDLDNPDFGDRGAADQGRGTMDNLGGKVKEGWGNPTGDKSDELQGAGQLESDVDDTLDR
jgi:uncharacterized protein YjbJ (UPF0337 family)